MIAQFIEMCLMMILKISGYVIMAGFHLIGGMIRLILLFIKIMFAIGGKFFNAIVMVMFTMMFLPFKILVMTLGILCLKSCRRSGRRHRW